MLMEENGVKAFDLRMRFENVLFVITSNDSAKTVCIDYYEIANCNGCKDAQSCDLKDDFPIACEYYDYMDFDEFSKLIKEKYEDKINCLIMLLSIWCDDYTFIMKCIGEKIDKYETE